MTNTAMLKMIEKGRIYIAPKLGVSEYILNEDEQALEDILSESEDPDFIQAFSVEEFDSIFIEGIHHDQQILEALYSKWEKINQDPKYDELVYRIKGELMDKSINDNGKLIVFSESKEQQII